MDIPTHWLAKLLYMHIKQAIEIDTIIYSTRTPTAVTRKDRHRRRTEQSRTDQIRSGRNFTRKKKRGKK